MRKIVASGGLNDHSGRVEGDETVRALAGLGVPAGDIFGENKATNTLENVLFSREIIDHQIGLDNVGSIVGAVKNFHARRALMTLKRHMPPRIRLKVSAYRSAHYDFDKDDWNQTEFGREKVLGELRKIERYKIKGDIAEL